MNLEEAKAILWDAWSTNNYEERYDLLKVFSSIRPVDYPFFTEGYPTILSDGHYDDEAIIFALSILEQISELEEKGERGRY